MPSTALLAPWRQLAHKADAFFERVFSAHREQMRCAAGCSLCCRQQLTVLLPEAIALLEGLSRLPAATRAALGARASRPGTLDSCALLHDDRCALYAERPLLCRTHGVPIRQRLALAEGAPAGDPARPEISCCELNFVGRELDGGQFPEGDVLDGTTLAAMLVVVDAMTRQALGVTAPLRIAIRELVARGTAALPPALRGRVEPAIL